MNKLFFLSLFLAASAFGESIILMNQTSYPNKIKHSKLMVQWASSAKEVNEANQAVMQGSTLNPYTMQTISGSGKTKLTTPSTAEYFRVIAWSKDQADPDFLTNWVDIVPNKVYVLEDDHLVPSVLMSGSGC